MDASTIALLIGVATLLIERGFKWALRIKRSRCCGAEIEMRDVESGDETPRDS
jgi:hypothetical protein